MLYFSVRLKANLIEFCMHCQSLLLEPNFEKEKKAKHLIYKLFILFTLQFDIIVFFFSKHLNFLLFTKVVSV